MRYGEHSERGATAVFIAGALILLLGMAAIATDIGAGFNERRQAQSAADFSVLAAVAFSNLDSVPTECDAHNASATVARAMCRGAVEAMAVAQGNLPGRTLDWAGCTDPEPARAAIFPVVARVELSPGVLSDVPCIRYTASTQGARVVVPDLEVSTTFGRVLGAESINTAANAEALSDLIDIYKVIPFGIPANSASSYDCLKSGPNPDWGVCVGNSANGNFGYMSVPTYGNPSMGTTLSTNCTTPNSVLISNIVKGVDHPLGTHPSGVASAGQPALNDGSGPDTTSRIHVCPIFGSNANELDNATGNVQSAFETGMTFGFGSSERGRLWPASGGITIRNAGGGSPATLVDDVPVWNWFTTYTTGASSAPCPHDTGLTVNNTTTARDCLDSWTPGDGEIFVEDIRDAKRYAFAPKLHANFSAASNYLIEEIIPLYLQTSYWGCNSGGGGMAGICDIIHSPGETGPGSCSAVPAAAPPGSEPLDSTCGMPGSQNDALHAVTTFIITPGMLPATAMLPSDPAEFVRLALTR
jgi:Flp pilus assembly protein TadG